MKVGAVVKSAGRYAGRVPADWRERFIGAFDLEVQAYPMPSGSAESASSTNTSDGSGFER